MIKKIWEEVKFMFKRVSQTDAILNEMREAEHALLRAETGVEYAGALVTYNKNRIKRLKAYLAAEEPKETT
jgi:hypothetical protein